MSEFYAAADERPVTRPEDDPLLTVRMAPPNTQARRLDPAARRVVKVNEWEPSWQVVGVAGRMSLRDDDVRNWPVQPHVCWAVAMDRAAGIAPAAPARKAAAPELVGDMGVESFRG